VWPLLDGAVEGEMNWGYVQKSHPKGPGQQCRDVLKM
jgi:hypothetical protein